LERLRGMPVDLVLPGHEYVFEHLEGRIEEIERHHKRRCN